MKKVGIIGCGNMGSAIAERIEARYTVCAFDKDTVKLDSLGSLVKKVLNAALVVQESDIVILAIKPQDFPRVLGIIQKVSTDSDKLFISIAAGVTTASIENVLGKARVIRTMPNMPAQIGEGITALSKGAFATEEDLKMAEDIFACVGVTIIIPESMMNAVTAVSGSGPAYVCDYIESNSLNPNDISEKEVQNFLNDFQRAAMGVGFSAEEAQVLVNTTFSGTINFLKKTKILPRELKKQVASKGGTTEAGLEVLRRGGALAGAVKAAQSRAEELSKKE